MGPWTHTYPCRVPPGPLIGYLQEAIRWWKHWLAAEQTGIMDEPLYRVWITAEERPRPAYPEHAGQWAAETAWPSPRIDWQIRYLNEGRLDLAAAPAGEAQTMSCPGTAGTDYGRWGGNGGSAPDLAVDQRREDGQSLCFDTAPLEQDITLLGAPEIELEIVVDKPLVNLAARLCDVYPDGTSAVMTYGILNLSHRNSHEHPEPCPVGTPFRVKLKLNDFGRTIPRGHRLRLAIQNQFWFVVWPQPELSLMTIASGRSTVRLPVRPPAAQDRAVNFAPAEISPPVPTTTLRREAHEKTVADDLATGIRTIHLFTDYGAWRIEDRAIEGSASHEDTFTIHPNDPLSASLLSEYRWSMKSGPADVSGIATTGLRADATHFHLSWRIEVSEGGASVFSSGEEHIIPRDFC